MRKRFLSLALALVLCMGLTVPAMAAVTVTEIAAPGVYQELSDYSDGLMVVKKNDNGVWYSAAIDTKGKEVIPAGSYDILSGFSGGMAQVNGQNGVGYIDKTGKLAVPCEYGRTSHGFSDGMALVYDYEAQKYGFVDQTGALAIPYQYAIYNFFGSKQPDFSDGLALIYDAANAGYGYIDKTGKTVIPCQYSDARAFAGGYAAVRLGNRWTLIDTTGKDLIPAQYTYNVDDTSDWRLNIFSNGGVVRVGKDPRFSQLCLIDITGREVAAFNNSAGDSYIDDFYNGLARIAGFNYQDIGFIDATGKLVIPRQYSGNVDFAEGYARVSYNGKTAYIDMAGNAAVLREGLTAPVFNNSALYFDLSEGLFPVSSRESGQDRAGFIDMTGKEVVPCKYLQVQTFSGGVAAVKDFEGKWGFVDATGAEIVPCQYSDVIYSETEKGIFKVRDWNDRNVWSLLAASGASAPAAPSVPSTPAQPAGPSANPTNSKVLVNGKEVAFDAYTIDGSNYFKLRDLAYVLNGTEKQFEVGWDNASKTITLTSGSAYTANGSEMAKGSGAQSASVSASKLLIDGKEVSLTAYTIGGNNYFKLRDIGQAFDFGIGWDNATKTITIDTSAGYTA